MMIFDYVGDGEVMVYPLVRTTETSSERSSGQLSCLIARPPDEISLTRHEHGPGWSPCSPEHCPVCRLQARGVGACPEVALSTIERFEFVRLLSGPRPTSRGVELKPAWSSSRWFIYRGSSHSVCR